jgi:cyclopropane-fatty-acyl-phospholipid synthase
MWEFYLLSCEAGFRWGGLTVFQLQLAKDIAALPITRDYMAREEQRLRAADSPLGEEPAPAAWAAAKPHGGPAEPGDRPRY